MLASEQSADDDFDGSSSVEVRDGRFIGEDNDRSCA